MRSFCIAALVATAAATECDKTTCSLTTTTAGYKIIQVIHPTNTDFETVCHDGQDYSDGSQNVPHVAGVTKHCAILTGTTECQCHKAGSHPNGAAPVDVPNGALASPTNAYAADTEASHAAAAAKDAAMAAHEAINNLSAMDKDYTHAATVRDGTAYAAHNGHV